MKNETYSCEYFKFHIMNGKEGLHIGYSSNPDKYYVYPPTNNDELKGLADFIYQYLQSNDNPN